MYQMVHWSVPTLQPREKMLAAAVAHAREAGIAELSLRQIADAIGTSHRMLLYHFGSREGLLTAVTTAVEEAERANLLDRGAFTDTRGFWDHISSPSLRSQARLFFEIYTHALLGRREPGGFVDRVVDDWVEPITQRLVDSGIASDLAAAHARLGLAVVRGLLLDLLATNDLAGATRAFDLYVDTVVATLTNRPGTAAAPS
jgi:AcrR family transcriptional regulator